MQQETFTYHPGALKTARGFRPVIRVFRNGKPVGSATPESRLECYPEKAMALIIAELAAINAVPLARQYSPDATAVYSVSLPH